MREVLAGTSEPGAIRSGVDREPGSEITVMAEGVEYLLEYRAYTPPASFSKFDIPAVVS